MPFGPEVSWPYGFRQIDPESRGVLESAYSPGAVYQPPAMDDYGDPGYSDPSYDGPRPTAAGQAFPGDQAAWSPGYQQAGQEPSGYPGTQGYAGPSGYAGTSGPAEGSGYEVPGYPGLAAEPDGAGIWPVTGAQEALPGTGPQPAVYPEQWYGYPRMDDRARRDPRLEGINYSELRYDDDPPGSGYDALDDESWYQELQRSAPDYPQMGLGPEHPSGPHRRVDGYQPESGPQPAGGPRPGGGTQPGAGLRPGGGPRAGYGQPGGYPGSGHSGSGFPQSGFPQGTDRPGGGYGSPRGDREGPRMSAAPRPGGEPGPGGFFTAPVAQVGVLTPPSGTRADDLQDGFGPGPDAGGELLAGPETGSELLADPVRPGHGLDGPAITGSWPAQPQADDLDEYEEFWREDVDEEYSGLFGDREAEFGRADAKKAAARKKAAAGRRTGRRRGGSNDHRLWLGLGGVVVLAAAAIVGVLKFEFPAHSGPVHAMSTPPRIGSYARTVDLEHQTDLAKLRAEVIKMSSGQASRVVSAIYESGNSAAGNTEQIVMFIGGHLANADPAASITGFTQKFPGARVTGAGSLGGKAACVQEANHVAMCVWFDDDSFGEVVSPTMNAAALGTEMRTMRPSVERVVAK